VKFQRDPVDRRYPERLAGSFLASLLLHVLLAALLFTVLVSSSEQGANENVQGGEVITLSRTSPVVVPNQPAATRAIAPMPHVPEIAPLHHAPLTAPLAQRLPVNRHELAKSAPTAPPNPRPPQLRSAFSAGQHSDGWTDRSCVEAPADRRAVAGAFDGARCSGLTEARGSNGAA
jgi:hypothetical protein